MFIQKHKHTWFNSFLFLTLLFVLMFQGCNKKDDLVIKKKVFIAVLSEMLVIEKLKIDDDKKIALAKEVLEKHQINEKQFMATKEYYKNDPKFWMRAYKKAEQLIKEKKEKTSSQLKP